MTFPRSHTEPPTAEHAASLSGMAQEHQGKSRKELSSARPSPPFDRWGKLGPMKERHLSKKRLKQRIRDIPEYLKKKKKGFFSTALPSVRPSTHSRAIGIPILHDLQTPSGAVRVKKWD